MAGLKVQNGAVPSPDHGPNRRPDGSTQRQHILRTALSLMATKGVDGTSMRNLATATGLNVASLYHYFPSKRELLVAVLEERGFVDGLEATSRTALAQDPTSSLAELLDGSLQSMLEVEEFVRLMLGEVMRGDDTAFAVGNELFTAAHDSLERSLTESDPPLCRPGEEAAMARMLRSLLIGLFIEHVAGVLSDDQDPSVVFHSRAEEFAWLLEERRPG
jgi:AcrR family transcriptional regulator